MLESLQASSPSVDLLQYWIKHVLAELSREVWHFGNLHFIHRSRVDFTIRIFHHIVMQPFVPKLQLQVMIQDALSP
jgi:hypothetical protein